MRFVLGLAVLAMAAGTTAAAQSDRFVRCPRLDHATDLPMRPGGHVLRGDVDGDGTTDKVSVRYEPRARSRCAFLLVVETGQGVRAIVAPALGKGLVESGRQHAAEYPEPAPGLLVRIRPHGLVVLLLTEHGASTVAARPYWLAGQQLRGAAGELNFYGSVAHNNQVNCYRGARSGLIVATAEWIANDRATRWSFSREISRLTNRGLEHLRSTELTVSTKKARALERRWRLGAPPFFSCSVADRF